MTLPGSHRTAPHWKAEKSFGGGVGIYSFIDVVFVIALMLYPANGGLIVVSSLGEARTEPYVIMNLIVSPIAISAFILSKQFYLSRGISLLAAGFIACCTVSLLFNLDVILDSELKGRSGISRFLTGVSLVLFGFYFATLTYSYAMRDLRRFIILPLFFGAIVSCAVSLVEVVSWNNSSIRSIYLLLSNIVHSANSRGESIAGRVQGLAIEASNFGFYVVMTIPLLLAFANAQSRSLLRSGCYATVILLSILGFLSGRTSIIGVLIVLVSYYVFKATFQSGSPGKLIRRLILILVILICVGPIFAILFYGDEIAMFLLYYDSTTVSNVSRFATQYIQLELFANHPLLGVGFNQTGYYVPSTIPSWAINWETNRWILDPNASFFPSFSLVTRIAGELGLVGLIFWISTFVLLLNAVFRRAEEIHRSGISVGLGAGICAMFIGYVFISWTIASLKFANTWILLGLSFAYLRVGESMELCLGARPSGKRLRHE